MKVFPKLTPPPIWHQYGPSTCASIMADDYGSHPDTFSATGSIARGANDERVGGAHWPGSSQFYEQWTGSLQLQLVDWIVLVRVLIVAAAAGTRAFPLAVKLSPTKSRQHKHKSKDRHAVQNAHNVFALRVVLPFWCAWRDSESWRSWICNQSKPAERGHKRKKITSVWFQTRN